MFQVDDAVVHPAHGPGVVTRVGPNGHGRPGTQYYWIKLVLPQATTVIMQAADANRRGLRSAIPEGGVKALWEQFASEPMPLPRSYKARSAKIEEVLEGSALDIARLLRDLTWRFRRTDRISRVDQRGVAAAVDRIARHVAAVERIEVKQAAALVRQRLAQGIESRLAELGQADTVPP
jgi:RNA polymerase-interacting CarD/CdnL/TRCF family regulator